MTTTLSGVQQKKRTQNFLTSKPLKAKLFEILISPTTGRIRSLPEFFAAPIIFFIPLMIQRLKLNFFSQLWENSAKQIFPRCLIGKPLTASREHCKFATRSHFFSMSRSRLVKFRYCTPALHFGIASAILKALTTIRSSSRTTMRHAHQFHLRGTPGLFGKKVLDPFPESKVKMPISISLTDRSRSYFLFNIYIS